MTQKNHLKTVRIESLVPDDRNANKGRKRGKDLVEKSLRDFGAGRSILLDRDGRVIAGNKTLDAAKLNGLQTVRVVETDGTELVAVRRMDISLDDAKGRQLAIADNRTAEIGLEWDPEVLAQLASDLDLQPFFTDAELRNIIPNKESNLLTDEDSVPDAPKQPTTKLGDLIVLGNHRLLCGDSTEAADVERLIEGHKADMVFTDPPYGINFQSGMSKGGTATRFDPLENDDQILDIAPIVWSVMADNSACFVWTSHHVYPRWREQFASYYKGTIIWHKPGGGIGDLTGNYATDYEIALFCVKGRPSFRGKRGMAVWVESKDAAVSYVHPTQKPVSLAERAINDFSDPLDSILDLFGGSGSTLIACQKTDRRARLMELDPRYCDVIVQRWENATGQKAIRCQADDQSRPS